MPGWVILLVEFLLNVGGNVLFDVVLFKSLKTAIIDDNASIA